MKQVLLSIKILLLMASGIHFQGCNKVDDNNYKYRAWIGNWRYERKEGYFTLDIDDNFNGKYVEDLGGGQGATMDHKVYIMETKMNFRDGLNRHIYHLNIVEQPSPVPSSDSIWVPNSYPRKLATWKARLNTKKWYALGDAVFYR